MKTPGDMLWMSGVVCLNSLFHDSEVTLAHAKAATSTFENEAILNGETYAAIREDDGTTRKNPQNDTAVENERTDSLSDFYSCLYFWMTTARVTVISNACEGVD